MTEHGALMVASGLNSPAAARMSLAIIRAFVQLREILSTHRELSVKLSELERKLEGHDAAIANLFEAMRQILAPPGLSRNEKSTHRSRVKLVLEIALVAGSD